MRTFAVFAVLFAFLACAFAQPSYSDWETCGEMILTETLPWPRYQLQDYASFCQNQSGFTSFGHIFSDAEARYPGLRTGNSEDPDNVDDVEITIFWPPSFSTPIYLPTTIGSAALTDSAGSTQFASNGKASHVTATVPDYLVDGRNVMVLHFSGLGPNKLYQFDIPTAYIPSPIGA